MIEAYVYNVLVSDIFLITSAHRELPGYSETLIAAAGVGIPSRQTRFGRSLSQVSLRVEDRDLAFKPDKASSTSSTTQSVTPGPGSLLPPCWHRLGNLASTSSSSTGVAAQPTNLQAIFGSLRGLTWATECLGDPQFRGV
eukprot:2467296-Rhodomonas_salina.1